MASFDVGEPVDIHGGKCWCRRFDVPPCCGRYLEDELGHLVHTLTVCYDARTLKPLPRP